MSRTVAIVFDPDFSSRLGTLAFHTPVWLADTPANRAAAEDAWRQSVEWPHISVTMFRPFDAADDQGEWTHLLGVISLQQRTSATLDAIGVALTPAARTALEDAGFVHIDATADGFRASKRKRG